MLLSGIISMELNLKLAFLVWLIYNIICMFESAIQCSWLDNKRFGNIMYRWSLDILKKDVSRNIFIPIELHWAFPIMKKYRIYKEK